MTPERKPWDRCKGETRKAYEAFLCYRDMGDSRRLVDVGEKLGKSEALMERWSFKWGWVDRVAAYEEGVRAEAEHRLFEAQVDEQLAAIAETLRQSKLRLQAADGVTAAVSQTLAQFLKTASDLEKLPASKLIPFLNGIALALKNAQTVRRVEAGEIPSDAEGEGDAARAMEIARKALELLERQHDRSDA